MVRLIMLEVLAGFFFSSTFILNELMANQGGHWFWSASLCYLFIFGIISLIILIKNGQQTLWTLGKLLYQNWRFWCLAGGIGFGGFYALLCFGASYASGWVVAATFQFTSVASLLILWFLGKKIFGKS